jgi:hypothetical protein
MRSFFINYKDGNISLYEYIDNELIVFKNKGEVEQTYKNDDFWNWWRGKIEYQNEEVSFLIATDQDEFDIPDNIQIATQNILSKKIITKKTKINFNNLKVINYPLIEKKDVFDFMKEEMKTSKSMQLAKTFEKFISPLIQIPKIVWNKIEKEKEKRVDNLEQLKIKSETRL